MAIDIVESSDTPNEGRVIWNDNDIYLDGRINEVELGIDAYSTTSASFVQPAVDATVSVTVDETGWMAVGQPVYMVTGGHYSVSSVTDTTTVVLTNLGYSGNAAPAATVASGKKVSPSGPIGATGPEGSEGSSGSSSAMWDSVFVATTANITLSGTQTIDGWAVAAGKRVLVKNQSTGSQNGIYVCASGAWSRATDADASGDFADGKLVYVQTGGVNGKEFWTLDTGGASITLGTTSLLFFQAPRTAAETIFGIARIATQAEVDAGVGDDPETFVTPETLSAYTGITNKLLTSDYQARDPKDSVRVATTANITLSGAQTIDGISVVAGNRVLVKNQSTGSQNGIYLCASGAWTRAPEADASQKVTPQMYMRVEEGTANGSKEFYLSNTGSITLGTTALTFAERAGGAVSSVFTRTGAVVAVSGDYTAAQITNTPAGSIAATTVQAALNELDTEKASATSVSDHLADASDAHDGSAVSFVPTGSIAATNVQAAIEEVASEAGSGSGIASVDGVSNPGGNIDLVAGSNVTITPDDTANTITIDSTGGGTTLPVADTTAIVKDATDNTKLVRVEAGAIATGTTRVINMPNADVSLGDIADHIADASAAHAASAVGFTPAGTIAATNVQAAIEEVASEASGGSGYIPSWVAQTTNAKFAAMADGDPGAAWSHAFHADQALTLNGIATNVVRLMKFRYPKQQVVDHVWIPALSSTSSLALAIYRASDLVRMWTATPSLTASWNDVTTNTPFTLAANTDYWLAFTATGSGTTNLLMSWGTNANVVSRSERTGPLVGIGVGVPELAQVSTTSGALPDPLGTPVAAAYGSLGHTYVFTQGTAS